MMAANLAGAIKAQFESYAETIKSSTNIPVLEFTASDKANQQEQRQKQSADSKEYARRMERKYLTA